MFLLLASIAALCMGPALGLIPSQRSQAIAGIDGFVVMAVGGLVLFDILPHSLADAGWPAWLAAGIGLLAPAAFHGPLEDCSGRATAPLVVAGALAFAVHAMFDGVALVNAGHTSLLGWAVVLHRVLEGLAIWWLIRPHQGPRLTWVFLGIIAGATLLGFWGGDWALSHGFAAPLGMLQAGVAGSLMHVLLRHAPPAVASAGHRGHLASGFGGLAAAGVLAALLAEHAAEAGHHDHVHAAGLWQWDTAGHLCLGLLLAYAVTAVLHACLEARSADHTSLATPHHGAVRQALTGAWAGLVVAECSCGVVPLYRRLLERHAGGTRALAFLFAAPLVGCSSLVLSAWMLGGRITLLRAGVSLVLAVVTAILTHALAPRSPTDMQALVPASDKAPAPASAHTHRGRIADALHFTFGEVLDRSSPWVLFGLILAQLAAGARVESVRGTPAEVLLFAVIATPFYLSATAATLVAGVLLAGGVSTGAVLAFLLLSSGLGLGTISLIHKRYGVRVCVLATTVAWAVAVMAGLAVPADLVQTAQRAPQGNIAHALGMAALACVAGLFLFSLLRQGVRPFLGQVALPNTMGRHSHHHDHGDGAHHH